MIDGYSAPFLVATVLHPAGSISEALLTDGLAELVDWSVKLIRTPGAAAKLQQAEQ